MKPNMRTKVLSTKSRVTKDDVNIHLELQHTLSHSLFLKHQERDIEHSALASPQKATNVSSRGFRSASHFHDSHQEV